MDDDGVGGVGENDDDPLKKRMFDERVRHVCVVGVGDEIEILSNKKKKKKDQWFGGDGDMMMMMWMMVVME